MMKKQKSYWLMKSEPDVYSYQKLQTDGVTLWSGVRNYQARNFMMQNMKPGDEVLFYHSNAEPPGIAGLAKVASLAEPDPTQFDKKSEYFAPKASTDKPIWFCVQVKPVQALPQYIPLEKLRSEPALQDMLVIKKGQRLSIQPVTELEFNQVKKMGGLKS